MYKCKVRNWWRNNPTWPDGLEPGAQRWESVPTRASFETEAAAIEWCAEYNRTHKAGRLSRKAEFSDM